METKHQLMRVAYELISHRDGVSEIRETAPREQPFTFITGYNFTIDAFEENLKDLKKGDTFDFTIPYSECHGEYEPENMEECKRDVFTIDGKFDSAHVFAGNIIEVNRGGMLVYAVVKEVTPVKVVLDYNHPLAGCDLQFVGSVVESRPATEKEIRRFEEAMKPSGCSCGCSGCGGGECGEGCGEGCGGCH